jgi:hypothetical protein
MSIARTGAKSLRATVPEGIVAFLQLVEGDKLAWRMDVQNGERIVIVRKVNIPPSTQKEPKKRK